MLEYVEKKLLLPGMHLKCKDEKKTSLLFSYENLAELADNILCFPKKIFFLILLLPPTLGILKIL